MEFSRGFPRMSFDGIRFPVARVRVVGGLREHVHEYRKVPGGAPEKLGRKLYVIEVDALFHDVFPDYGTSLYPLDLARLRAKLEQQITADLVVPMVGTIQAYAIDWTQEFDAKVQSGERATLRFREDGSSALLIDTVLATSQSGVGDAGVRFTSVVEEGGYSESLFDAIGNAVNAIGAIGDQVELYGNYLEAKALGLARLCEQADASLAVFQDPRNHVLHGALLALWDAALSLQKNATRASAKIVEFSVPREMAIQDIARIVYADAARATEIMQMNPIEDVFRVPAGTVLKVFAAAA